MSERMKRPGVMSRLKNMGLADKFMGIILLCLIIPLILVFLVMNSVVTEQFLNKQYEKELEILKQSRPSMENVLTDVMDLSRNLTSSREIQTLFNEFQESGEVKEESLMDVILMIEQQKKKKKYISSVSLFCEEQILYQYRNYYEKEEILEQTDKMNEMEELEGKVIWEPAKMLEGYTGGMGNEEVASLYRIVNHLYRIVPIGIERISISEEYLCSLYGNGGNGEGDYAFIFDSEGYVASAQNKDMLGERVSHDIRTRTEHSEGYYVSEDEGKAVFYYQLPVNGWTVVQVRSLTSLKEQMSLINVIFWTALILSIFFGVIFSIWQKRAVINPIVKLAKDVETIDEGNYSIHLYSGSRDEVSHLNQSIIRMTERIRELIETVYKGQLQCREAEVLSLQSQINPHFLYNTLDTMRWIAIEHGEKDLAEQIEALSGMFRHVLNNGQETTTVGEEVRHLNNYLTLQKSRFGEKIKVDIQMDEDLENCIVLKLVLQPIVENAFVHGLEEKVGGGHIWVSVKSFGRDIIYKVRDDGVGTEPTAIQKILQQKETTDKIYALKNVNDRIHLKYGEGYGVQFDSTPGKGTVVCVRISKAFREETENEDIDC